MRIILALVMMSVGPARADQTAQMADKVVELRQEVETLNERYQTEKEKVYNDLKVIGARKAELESNIQSDRLRNKQLSTKIQAIKTSINQTAAFSGDLLPLFNKNIASLRDSVQSTLPFKTADRLKSIDQLKQKVDKKEISVAKGMARLWSLLEDEKRLARENSLEKQIIHVNGKDQLAQVAKLGMMALYFSTEDGHFGQAVQSGEGAWSFKTYDDGGQIKQVKNLITSLKKQIRTGYFEVPVSI